MFFKGSKARDRRIGQSVLEENFPVRVTASNDGSAEIEVPNFRPNVMNRLYEKT